MAIIHPGQILAPSEVVFLAADQFLEKAPLPKQRVISFQTILYPLADGSGMGVSKQPLAELACMAAFLAIQDAGGIRLEIRATKALFGLRTIQMLFANLGSETPAWPEASLENVIQPMVRVLQASGHNEAGTIIYRLFGNFSYDPFGWVCEQVRDGLAKRGLLTAKDYLMTYPARDAAAAQFDETKALLVECQHGHADVWDVLHARVYQEIKRREARVNDA